MRWLIGKKQSRLLHDGPRDAHALALSARELVCPAIGEIRAEPHGIEKREGTVDIGLRELPQESPPRADIAETAREDVLHHTQAFHEVVFLENHADAPARIAQIPPLEAGKVFSLEQDIARRGVHQPVDAADQR